MPRWRCVASSTMQVRVSSAVESCLAVFQGDDGRRRRFPTRCHFCRLKIPHPSDVQQTNTSGVHLCMCAGLVQGLSHLDLGSGLGTPDPQGPAARIAAALDAAVRNQLAPSVLEERYLVAAALLATSGARPAGVQRGEAWGEGWGVVPGVSAREGALLKGGAGAGMGELSESPSEDDVGAVGIEEGAGGPGHAAVPPTSQQAHALLHSLCAAPLSRWVGWRPGGGQRLHIVSDLRRPSGYLPSRFGLAVP